MSSSLTPSNHNNKSKTSRKDHKTTSLATNGQETKPQPSVDVSKSPNGSCAPKRKRASPFRVKVGCVVALRFRPELSNVPITLVQSPSLAESEAPDTSCSKTLHFDENWTYAWCQPYPGRDQGLALIGKRIRCFFPHHERKVLQGEIISLFDSGKNSSNSNSNKRGFVVELLVDQTQHTEHFSFLPCTTPPAPSSSASPHQQSKKDGKARRNNELEERIRGRNKVAVQVALMKGWWMDCSSSCMAEDAKFNRWAIQKLVPLKLFGTRKDKGTITATTLPPVPTEPATAEMETNDNTAKRSLADNDTAAANKKRRKVSSAPISTSARHMGDGNDDGDQQMNNWRWTVARYHDVLYREATNTNAMQGEDVMWSAPILSGGFVGKVLRVDASSGNSTTLALVTLQRLFLPEHTGQGRLAHHAANSVFSCTETQTVDQQHQNRQILLKVPIEHLIIVGRKLQSGDSAIASEQQRINAQGDSVLGTLVETESYSFSKDAFSPVSRDNTNPPKDICHRCRRPQTDPVVSSGGTNKWCQWCLEEVHEVECKLSAQEGPVETIRQCNCSDCHAVRVQESEEQLYHAMVCSQAKTKTEASDMFSVATRGLQMMGGVSDFLLPDDFNNSSSFPTAFHKPSAKVKLRQPKKMKRPTPNRLGRLPGRNIDYDKNGSRQKRTANNSTANGNDSSASLAEDFSVFRPTCARLVRYGHKQKSSNAVSQMACYEKPRNLREKLTERNAKEPEQREEKSTSGRAARANQRRVMKDVASFGVINSLAIDTLASRGPQLRFDRSSIHAWGVFADEDIAGGEMIIEYRGELIGNSIAEKREKEYEDAKIGSDYMFRVDALNVCDATKQGNVARFINASCGPNCYTKIITLDGNKRIAIYAKRNIRAGEELCYDYKFPLEYDESKRIPCHCGAKECRGFMNWDKRYVAIPPLDPSSGGESGQPDEGKVRVKDTLG